MKTATLDNPQVQTVRYNGGLYKAVKPQADNDELAASGSRVILYHRRCGAGLHTAELQIAPAGLVCSGLVIGIIEGPLSKSETGLNPPLLHTNIPRARSRDNFDRAIDLQPASDVHSWEGGDR